MKQHRKLHILPIFGAQFTYKDLSFRVYDSYYCDKLVVRPSDRCNGNPYTGTGMISPVPVKPVKLLLGILAKRKVAATPVR